jgi:hypothetical protein
MLQVALNNNLITQKEFDNIEGFEILRGDNTVHKSVIASGLAFDMYNYNKKDGEKWWYSNFPFNDLGADKFHTIDEGRTTLIQHPFGGNSNHLFSFLSPDLLITKTAIPTEVIISGYQFGNAKQSVVQQNEFPKYTILGEDARDLADTLAVAESILEIAVKVGELVSSHFAVFGPSSGGSIIGAVGAVTAGIAMGIGAYIRIGQYRYEWLKTFRDLGATHNFAHFTAGVGTYNKFLKSSESEVRALTIRKYLKEGMPSFVDKSTSKRVNVNNDQREDAVLLSFGKEDFNLVYPTEYKNYDNNLANSKSSKIIAKDLGCETGTSSIRDVASPYFTLKNYIPDQWDNIDTVQWLTTNHMFKLTDNTDCKPIFGGTMVISPFSRRRKVKLFRENAMQQPDKSPFDYSKSNNIGVTRFYVDYETSADPYNQGVASFPDIVNTYNFDCETGRNGFYVKTPSKFYTHSHGIIEFLVESEINCHFRYQGKEPKDWFYQDGMNINDYLQESFLPISLQETFKFNNAYRFPVSSSPYKFLDYTYDKEIWRKRNYKPNGIYYSEMDNNENDQTDPWRVYKPLNFIELDTKYGKLIDIKDLEGFQYMARFENGRLLYDSYDKLADKVTQQNKELGTGGLFADRPIEFKMTDLGFEGTQNSDICSTPYGHFTVDALRGRIFQIDNGGKQSQIISEQAGDKPSGMKQWFREHLPFKILKQLPEIDIDNKFKGIGLNIWYDDRNSRVFFTKRDYISKNNPCLKYDKEIGFYDSCLQICPVGYTLNRLTNICEKVEDLPICQAGYTFNNTTNTCERTYTENAVCTKLQVSILTDSAKLGETPQNIQNFTPQQAKCFFENNSFQKQFYVGYSTNVSLSIGDYIYITPNGNLISTALNGTYIQQQLVGANPHPTDKYLTILNGLVTQIVVSSNLNPC